MSSLRNKGGGEEVVDRESHGGSRGNTAGPNTPKLEKNKNNAVSSKNL